MTSLNAPPSSSMFRRKRSLASTSVSTDDNAYGFGNTASSSSPLLLSPPLLTPLHLTRSRVCAEWLAADYADDSDVAIYARQEKTGDLSLSRSSHSAPLASPLPHLLSKSVERTPWSDAPLSCDPFPRQTSYFYPRGNSDDFEEYDLESMDIHIHETYFATSAERGRWMSSPIVPRTRFQASPRLRGHSSPIKKLTEDSPIGKRLSRHAESCIINPRIHTLSDDHDKDTRSSPLPPSSPLTSPLSTLSFFGDDCNDGSIADPCSNLGNFHSSSEPPASIHCAERSQTPHEASIFEPALLPSDPPSTPLSPAISCFSSPSPIHSPSPTGAPGFELDGALSPLSQFDLDLPEEELLKLPLSDMENRLHTEQCTGPGVTVDAVQGHGGFPSVRLLAVNTDCEPLDVSLDTICEASSRKVSKKTVERRTQRRPVVRCRSPSSKKRGTENHATNHLEPATKRSKPSRPKDGSETRSVKSRSRGSGEPMVRRRRKSPSRPALQRRDSESVCVRDTMILESAGEPDQAMPVCSNPANAELLASLTGILIEAFAASRATSMDATALYLVLSQAHPHLTTERSKQELLEDIVVVLEAGRVRCGMFEKVDSSGEGSRHKALEGRWFYIPERDEDTERASLISAIMPRQKRSETKKYKQYYYRPLGKMSRWNPEDEP